MNTYNFDLYSLELNEVKRGGLYAPVYTYMMTKIEITLYMYYIK